MKRILSLVILLAVSIASLFGMSPRPLGGADNAPPVNSATVFFENAWRSITVGLARGCLAVHGWLRSHCFAAPLALGITTVERDTIERPGEVVELKMAAVKILQGTLVAINASGYAQEGADTANFTGYGRAEETVDNSGGDPGDLSIRVKRGVFKFANSAGNPLTVADIGTICYIEDNDTVAETTSNAAKAGLVVELATDGVWVDTRYHVPSAGTPGDGSVTTGKLADNAVTGAKLADAVSDQIFKTTVAVANTGTPDGVAHITGQVQDSEGNSLTGRFLVEVYLDGAAYGDPEDLGTLTAAANSRILKEHTDDALALVLTHSDGSWGVDLDTTIDGTIHAHAAVTGQFATANAAITGN